MIFKSNEQRTGTIKGKEKNENALSYSRYCGRSTLKMPGENEHSHFRSHAKMGHSQAVRVQFLLLRTGTSERLKQVFLLSWACMVHEGNRIYGEQQHIKLGYISSG